jgi:hypothetical protein
MIDVARKLELTRDVARLTADPLDELGIRFEPIRPEQHAESWRTFARAVREDRVPSRLVVYVHVPFCARVCSYCLLAATAAPGRRHIEAYVRALRAEIARQAPILAGLPVDAVHIGGGTPTLLSEAELDALLTDVASAFSHGPGFHIGIEGHPATTTREKAETLARRGVGRISLGVESFTPAVLTRVNRSDQSAVKVARAVEAARGAGLVVNLDLLAGLPGESLESFEASVRAALELEPDSLSVNRWLAEKSALATEGVVPSPEDGQLADRMLELADRIIRETRPPSDPPARAPFVAGYGTQYDWAPRTTGYFQQDMIGPSSILALGHGGLGHLFAGYFFTAAGSAAEWVAAVEAGRAPELLAAPVSRRFELAFALAEHAGRGCFDPSSTLGTEARGLFPSELDFLFDAGLLRNEGGRWSKPVREGFDAVQLMLFLLTSEDELGRRARQLRDAARPLTGGLRQYREIPAELPASVLWCRIAMRADATARRLASSEVG